MNWKGKDGNLYTDRNNPDIIKRAKWFNKILPKDIKEVFEFGCNKGHNLQAIASVRDVFVGGVDINDKAAAIARSKGIRAKTIGDNMELYAADLILFSGVLIHINPLKIAELFKFVNDITRDHSKKAEYVLMIEHKEDSIRTINSRWYNNSMWVMDFGKEFINTCHNWEIIKHGYVNGKKPKTIDYTSPLGDTKTGFHDTDYFWLIKRK